MCHIIDIYDSGCSDEMLYSAILDYCYFGEKYTPKPIKPYEDPQLKEISKIMRYKG